MRDALVNGRFLTRPPTGVDRFAIELTKAMGRRLGAKAMDVALPRGTGLSTNAAGPAYRLREVGRRQGHAWEQIDLSSAAGERALVNLCNTAPLMRRRQLVVIHDLASVANAANYSLSFRLWYRLMHGNVMKRSQVVATVSAFSADELTAHYGRRGKGVEVIHEGGEHILDQPADASILDKLDLGGRRYVLAVGSLSANKNLKSVIAAVRLLDDPSVVVVAVGGGNSRVFAGSPLQDELVKFTGYVSDAQLRALYESAACFAFPSYYEGFGLPPLEAMCCGCPVVVSDRASLPEVCGPAALYCKAEDPATLADALRGLLASPSRQEELRAAGFERSAHFGWDKAARHFEQVLDANFS